MKKALIIVLSAITLISCNENPKIDDTPLNYKDWSAQQELVNDVRVRMPGIDSVIAITDVIEVEGVKYVGLDVLYSEFLHWERLCDLYFDEMDESQIAPFDTVAFYENFETEYGKIYGEENIVRHEDNDFFRGCGQCGRTYQIKNIRIQMYGVLPKEAEYWQVRTDSKGIEKIPTQASRKSGRQDYLNENVPKEIQTQITDSLTYYAVTAFKNGIELDAENELHSAIGSYINAINEGNGKEELKFTHPNIVNAMELDAEINNTQSFLDTAGILTQKMKMSQVAYIYPVIKSNGTEYTKLMVIGSFQVDFSTMEVTPDISYLYSMLPTIYKEKYGASHVIADNETKIISVNNIETSVYATYNKQMGGWRFSTMPYAFDGLTVDKLWSYTHERKNINTDWWVGEMKRKKGRIDVIIPSEVLLKLE